MSYTHSFGGATTNNSFTSFPSSSGVYRDSTALPTARLAANGGRPIHVGSPSPRSATGAGGIQSFIESLPGDLGSGFASTSGGGFRFRIDYSSGTLTFARCSTDGGSIVDTGDSSTWVGSIPGSLLWEQVPTAPQSPAVASGVGSASLTWAAPADDGESAVTGYLIEWATNVGFTTGTGSKSVGVVTSDTVTGLTPGTTYYFRISAKNLVATTASTTSVPSSTVSAFIAAVPGAPTALAVTALPGTVSATATAPASDGGSAILDYLLEWSLDNFATTLGSVVVPTTRAKTVVGLAPGTTYYFRMKARNAVGYSTASTVVSTTTPTRTALDIVEFASLQVSPGVQVSLRSDAASSAAITLGFSALTDGTTWTTIATVTGFATPGGPRNLDLVADPSGNLFVIGNDASDPSKVLVKRYARTGSTNVWTLSGTLSQALPSTSDQLVGFAGAYVPATGTLAPKETIFLLARRAGTVGTGALSYATLDLAAIAASTGSLFVAYGSDPAWLAAPTSGEAVNTGRIDVALLTGTRVVGRANGLFVVDVENGVVSGVAKAADGASGAGTKVRVIAVDTSSFAVVSVASGALSVVFYGTNGALLGSASYAGANARGGAFASQWDAFFQRVTGTVRVYYVADDSDRKLEYVDVSPSTYLVGAAVVESTTLGAASSTNPAVRTPHRIVDERKILVEAANALTGVQSTASYSTTVGNVAPSAPTLTAKAAFDASAATVFAWTFGDSNPADAQTAFQLQVQRVSDSVDIVDTGKITSSTPSRTVAGGSLVNGVGYRWRVRTYDALDQVGAWSSYLTVTPSSLGTLTITAPVSDNLAGIDTSSYAVVWTYVQANGYTQTKRRVKVVRTSDSSVLSDTTLQVNTSGTFTVTGMLTDVEYRIELTIENSNGQSVGVNRLITPSFSRPMTPTVTFDEGDSFLDVVIENPAPSGARPDTVLNYVHKRETGSTDWTRIGAVVKNGTFRDRAVRSGGSYDYKIEATS